MGELSAQSGLSRDALRYYKRLGRMPRAGRTTGGFRLYPAGTLDRIRFIKQAQLHGLTLREIRELLDSAKVGILGGSNVSGVVGAIEVRRGTRSA
jgi:DNA-binding transcriptional MerR regulator